MAAAIFPGYGFYNTVTSEKCFQPFSHPCGAEKQDLAEKKREKDPCMGTQTEKDLEAASARESYFS